MRLCIAGGRLQGIEASYLAKKAGYRTVLIDKDPSPPARHLVDEFYQLDIINDNFDDVLDSCDVLLPALEKNDALIKLEECSKKHNVPFLHDNHAFSISQNKIKSKKLFQKINIPCPRSYDLSCDHFDYPLIMKPSCGSGSVGVMRLNDKNELLEALCKTPQDNEEIVIEEFIDGPALSLELIGDGKSVVPLMITFLEFDEDFSCKRVFTPEEVPHSVELNYVDSSVSIAKELKLKGIMDTQAIIDKGIPKMLEINARLPSQTPTVVYKSTGINIIELLCETFLNNDLPYIKILNNKFIIYQHIKIENNILYIKGESILKKSKNLTLKNDFFGADEAITNIETDCRFDKINNGVATLIVESNTFVEVQEKMKNTVNRIVESFNLEKVIDKNPFGVKYDKAHSC